MQTLRRERRQKFEEEIQSSQLHYYARLLLEHNGNTPEYVENTLRQCREDLALILADAAESRTERKTDETKPSYPIPDNMPLDWYIANGLPIPSHLTQDNAAKKQALDDFENALGLGTLPWGSNSDWTTFQNWVQKTHAGDKDCWKRFADWRKDGGKYEGITNGKIRQSPKMFIDTFYPTFLASSGMSEPKKPAPVYKHQEDNTNYVQAPARRKHE